MNKKLFGFHLLTKKKGTNHSSFSYTENLFILKIISARTFSLKCILLTVAEK